MYSPTIPIKKIIKPPKKNIEDKTETQPSAAMLNKTLFIIKYKTKKNELTVINKPL